MCSLRTSGDRPRLEADGESGKGDPDPTSPYGGPGRALAGRSLLAVVAGLSVAAAFHPWGSAYVGPIGVALLTVATVSLRGRSAAAVGACFGVAFVGSTCWWLWDSIGPGAWVALTLVQAGWFAALGVATSAVQRRREWPVWAALFWSAVEVLRSSWPFGGLPWGRLGFAAVDSAWAPALPLVGVTGTGFLLALTGTTLGALVVHVRSREPLTAAWRWAAVLAVVGAALASAARAVPAGPAEGTTARVGVVQGGVPGSGTRLIDHHREVTRNHLEQTRALAAGLSRRAEPPPDFVLWPENSTAVDVTRDEEARGVAAAATDLAQAPVLLGSVVEGPTPGTDANQGIVWTGEGPGARYTKQNLVPFGEYVPLRALATRLSSRVAAISHDMVPGDDARPLPVAGWRVADALCFDVAYDDVIGPQVRQGADLVTVQTSNAMFLGTGQLEQQWQISRARALEVGRSVVVASVNGVSGAIAPDGEVLTRLPVRVGASTVVEVPVAARTTTATVLGVWPSRGALALAGVGLVLAWRARRRAA